MESCRRCGGLCITFLRSTRNESKILGANFAVQTSWQMLHDVVRKLGHVAIFLFPLSLALRYTMLAVELCIAFRRALLTME